MSGKAEWVMAPPSEFPSVVVTLPFDPKMTSKGPIEAAIRDALATATRQLMARHPRNTALPVIDRLQRLTGNLNYATHKKSIALFVSAGMEKILYLDEPMEPKVLVDSNFRMRDLTVPGETVIQYLLLLLSGERSKIYLGEGGDLQLIKNNSFQPFHAYYGGEAKKIADFSDLSARKQVMLDKFLYDMDQGLAAILHAYPFPVFVVAPDKIAHRFAHVTCNHRHIGGYLHKNHIEAGKEELVGLLQPFLRDWRIVRQQIALQQVDTAGKAGKLAAGIDEVSKAVHSHNGRLLIIERGFSDSSGRPSYPNASGEFFIRDRVDAAVGEILQQGGQVEWVDQGRLRNQGRIALIRCY